ncbi:Mitochondrial glycoprotein [Quillaja saponaria]|uniref:Mitochondrial glycoprotein n=1 Tax=Quillaja saponaria TaxID=32244 RepID=A0AAD7LLP4_QUISA|nr:Mitochondrial glycoprotein [Quillaja saponaria]
MAFTSILRKSTSGLAPMAVSLVKRQRNYHAAFFTAINQTNLISGNYSLNPYVQTFQYSYLALRKKKMKTPDETLSRVIESEIKYSQGEEEDDSAESEFPFEVEDNPGRQLLTVKRTYKGEEIRVEVHKHDYDYDYDYEDEDEDDGDSARGRQSGIPLVVNVSKKDGPCMEFSCTAYPNEITLYAVAIIDPEFAEDEFAYEGPNFNDLDENLQKAFHKYLEIRGIKPCITSFLHEYMIDKDRREYLLWLKKVKKFIEA